ncbi:MAG: diaminopimelate epimerase [Sediminibacterium sp.]|nr:diaminopimelate epimerase [Sediminibacterium sp.]
MQIEFSKYHGTGNDFVIIDNRAGNIQLTKEQVHFICDSHFGIGADGLMLLGLKEGYDFEMTYFNADGALGSMCGNGGRCLTKFAYDCGIHKDQYHFIASDGPHEANFGRHQWIHLKMKDVNQIQTNHNASILDTGSPHYIKEVQNLAELNVFEEGRSIRYSSQFKEKGINVNFVEVNAQNIQVRTYERGVEDETFSCGTGVTAAALVFAHNENGFNRVEVSTKGGQLAVEFEKTGDTTFENIWLCGPAQFVFKGTIDC